MKWSFVPLNFILKLKIYIRNANTVNADCVIKDIPLHEAPTDLWPREVQYMLSGLILYDEEISVEVGSMRDVRVGLTQERNW